jgi:cytochrome d ubiquinol oxidase subunit II
LAITATGEYEADHHTGWMSPLTVFTGFYSVGMSAYLAAIYLAREAAVDKDDALTQLWRQRSLSTGLWMGLLSVSGLVMVWLEAPTLATGFLSRGWPLIIVSIMCGIGSLVEIWRHNFLRAVVASAGAVAAVIWGWGVSQYPTVVPPMITRDIAKAPENVLWMILAVSGTGAVFLLPSLVYLFALFKSATVQSQVSADSTNGKKITR